MRRLPEIPARTHPFFDYADAFVTLDEPTLYERPLRVRYKDLGSGPPLLLVHGLQTTGYSWRYVIEPLSRTFRVIVPDLVGCGMTDTPPDFGYHPARVAAFLEAFRRGVLAEHEPWNVVGNSLGGIYAACHAAQHPASVERLVIMHAPGFMRVAGKLGIELIRRGIAPSAISALFGPWMVRRYLRYHTPGLYSEEEVAEFGAALTTRDGRRAFWQIIREGLSPAAAGELGDVLAAVEAPTLLVWARNDTLIPPETAHRWQRALPHAQLEWVDDSSHFTQVDQPEATARLVAGFLCTGAG